MSSPHFTPDTAALVLIDHQVGTIQLIKNIMPDTAVRNAVLLGQAALAYKMPIVMTSSQEDHVQGPLHPLLQQTMPDAYAARVKRLGIVNAWTDPNFVRAIEATGRRQLIMAAVTTDICLVFPAISAVEAGYEVLAVMDACGTDTEIGEAMIAMSAGLSIAGLRSETETVGGVRLHYWVGGDPAGQPVILWHGFLSTGYAWREVATALAGAGMSVLVPDMRGFGDSDKPDGVESYDARALSKECRALVASIGFGAGRPLIHAAHDMGALPALIWSADHPDEVAALLYIEAPVMLGDVLRRVFTYTPDAMANGSMWWWILPLAPGVPEALIVGNERAFLQWFFQGPAAVHQDVFTPAVVDEYLRTFAGRTGVLGTLGVYRAAFTSIAQTEPLMTRKIKVPVVALGGEKGLGDKVGQMVAMVADNVEAHTLSDCGHFIPEERPQEIVRHILAVAAKPAIAASQGEAP